MRSCGGSQPACDWRETLSRNARPAARRSPRVNVGALRADFLCFARATSPPQFTANAVIVSNITVLRTTTKLRDTPPRKMNRRGFLAAAGATALGAAGCEFNLSDGVFNACAARLPERLRTDPLVEAAWRGLDPANVCDVHCHVFGNGDSGSGLWFNPALERFGAAAGLPPARVLPQRELCARSARRSRSKRGRPAAQSESTTCRRAFARSSSRSTGRVTRRGARIPSARRFMCRTTTARCSRSDIRSASSWAASIHPYDPAALDRLDAAAARGRARHQVAALGAGHRSRVGALRPLLRAPR